MTMANRTEAANEVEGLDREEEFSMLRHLVLGEEQSALRLVREQVQYLEQILRRQELRFASALEAQEKRLRENLGHDAFIWLKKRSETAEHYDAIGQLMSGPLEAGLRVSAGQNREGLAQTLAPVIGPGIRASVAEFFRRFVEQLDSLLRGANLPQRLWWRVLAARQGVPYSEFVLQRTARYAVLLVQLVERASGNILCEVGQHEHSDQSASFTSQSMLANAFLNQSVPEWESVRVTGRRLAMQLRVLGGGGEPVRKRASLILARCEQELDNAALEELDDEQLAHLQRVVQPLLSNEVRRSNPWLGGLVVTAGLAATAWWGFVSWKKHERESQFLAALSATPGIVVTNTEHRHGQLIVQGLRDPLAPHPEAFVAAHFNSPSEVAFEMGTYLSAGTDYERMRQVEQERREAQSLKALWEKNEAQRQLLEGLAARQDAALQARLANALGGTIPQSVTMQWENDTLNVTGSLPASKLTQLKEEIVRLQPMVSIDATKVTSEAELPDPKRLLESLDVPFLIGTPQFEATSASMVQQIVERMQAIDAQSKTERQYRLRAWPITGERMEGNLAVQLNRLSLVKAQLQALGYPISRIAPGVAEAESLAGRRGVWVEVLPENSEAPPGE